MTVHDPCRGGSARRFEVAVGAPFRLDLTVWALRRRPHNGVDTWDGTAWRRVVDVGGRAVGIAVRQHSRPGGPCLTVELDHGGAEPGEAQIDGLRRLVTRTLGLEADIAGFPAVADRDRRLAPLARRFAGLRPPRFPTVFEAVVNAVACQQLSLESGIHMLNRLVARFGPRVHPAGPAGFPAPERLAGADPCELRALGFSRAKATTLVSLARRVSAGSLDLEALSDLGDGAALAALVTLPGIGRWSGEYVLLRGLGRLAVLPGDDVGARNSLHRRFDLPSGAGYGEVAALSRAWWPYGGLVYFHLLLDGLARSGRLGPAEDLTTPITFGPGGAPPDAAGAAVGSAVA